VSPATGPKTVGSPGNSELPLVEVVAGVEVVVAAGVLVVVASDAVVVVASDEVVVSRTVVVVVDEAASSPQAPRTSTETARTARAGRDLKSILSLNQMNAGELPVGSNQVPVKSGFRFSMKAVIASVRSSEIK
jgi:hypothetical protein